MNMTPERIKELRDLANFTTGHRDREFECLDEIERLLADRDHWRKEYKTLELAGEELVKQRDMLKEQLRAVCNLTIEAGNKKIVETMNAAEAAINLRPCAEPLAARGRN